jgi:hypothetical protein
MKKVIFLVGFVFLMVCLYAQTSRSVTISGVIQGSNYVSNVIITDFRTSFTLRVGNINNGLLHIELPLSGLERFYNTRELVLNDGINIAWIEFITDTDPNKKYLSLVNFEESDLIRFIYADRVGSFEVVNRYGPNETIRVEQGWNFYSFKTGTCDTLENYYRKGYVWTFAMLQ